MKIPTRAQRNHEWLQAELDENRQLSHRGVIVEVKEIDGVIYAVKYGSEPQPLNEIIGQCMRHQTKELKAL